MRRYLITGGSGFLGINLIRYLLEKGDSATSLDIAEFDYEDCKDRIRIVTGDIRDPACVTEAMSQADLHHTTNQTPRPQLLSTNRQNCQGLINR